MSEVGQELDEEMLDLAKSAQEQRGADQPLCLGDVQTIMEAAYQHTETELRTLAKIRAQYAMTKEAKDWLAQAEADWRREMEAEGKAKWGGGALELLSGPRELEPEIDPRSRGRLLDPDEAAMLPVQALPKDLFDAEESEDEDEEASAAQERNRRKPSSVVQPTQKRQRLNQGGSRKGSLLKDETDQESEEEQELEEEKGSDNDDDDTDDEADLDFEVGAKRKLQKKQKEKERQQNKNQQKSPKPNGLASQSSKKSGVAVDPLVGEPAKWCHVYLDYHFMLNQTDISYGVKGHNKYYFGQILEKDRGSGYFVFFKWGRVGAASPQHQLKDHDSIQTAISQFEKKFMDKTKNSWRQRDSFRPVKGKYLYLPPVAPDSEEDEDDEEAEGQPPLEVPESKLPVDTQRIMDLICSKSGLTRAMVSMDIDVKRFPLGQLSPQQLNQGYAILEKLQEALEDDEDEKRTASRLKDLTSQFYTLIPHDFGMRLPPTIDSLKALQRKVDLLDNLREMQIASRILKQARKAKNKHLNPVDVQYDLLHCTLSPLESDAAEHAALAVAIQTTHGPTHTQYTLSIERIFVCTRARERVRFAPFAKLHNRQLLWHGSRLGNFAGILSKGLRVAPPEAPSTGYMFGKGLYFADVASKSANYVHASRDNPYGLLLLCDVALGDCYPLQKAEYLSMPPPPYHSTFGQGKYHPSASQALQEEDPRPILPIGPLTQPEDRANSKLLYNEFIVYDEAQIQMKYMVFVRFNFV
eukprot:gb/GEZN01002245.1/.p1 GENE.gb/GEZN01002245.1/~~gb/GEZN01002245.1/.p1  ORF type:complete len:752 (+),score=189.78 gb/GEZN01002245.1/:65-2320(+)